ncbi:MAG TPA: zinc-dependent alcohol dehydrogenase family protein [Candidatus Limnocylindria bacterium]|nr:zinc-dependent alcohol dehydrogenase family protein [Candidatus Limnocylindria bacterium]
MLAMVLDHPGEALRHSEISTPDPGPGQLLIQVHACAVCRTDLHIVDGELTQAKLPLILGHEIVGKVAQLGGGVSQFKIGDRVGVPWLGWTCGTCWYCRSDQENLCDHGKFTGYTIDGGYAEYTVADQRFCLPLPDGYSDAEAAPLLCAGLIGYRSLVKAGKAKRLGLYGFGAAAHIVAQVARYQQRAIYAFTRPGDEAAQQFAITLGAVWAGGSNQTPPEKLDAAIIFAPAGELVPLALKAVGKGGTVVCGGIHMSDIPSFSYSILWEERTLTSVANLTRRDGAEFMALAARVRVRTAVEAFELQQANEALRRLRDGKIEGAAVLTTAAANAQTV